LAGYFSNQPSLIPVGGTLIPVGGKLLDTASAVTFRPNVRKVSEAPYHLEQAGKWDQLYGLLSDSFFVYGAAVFDVSLLQIHWTALSQNSAYRACDGYRDIVQNPEQYEFKLLVAVQRVLDALGYFRESSRLINVVLSRARASGDRGLEATILTDRAAGRSKLGLLEEAARDCQTAADISRELADDATLAKATLMQAKSLSNQRDYNSAADHFDEAFEVFRSLGDAEGQIEALLGLTEVFMERGQLAEATNAINEASTHAERIGGKILYADCMMLRAALFEKTENDEGAEECLSAAEKIYRDAGNIEALGSVLNLKCGIATRSGQLDQAIDLLVEQEALAHRTGNPVDLAITLMNQSRFLVALEAMPRVALKCAQEAFQIVSEKNLTWLYGDARQTLSEAQEFSASDNGG
jgi:tetratricopeptide (TPR) repeat protein